MSVFKLWFEFSFQSMEIYQCLDHLDLLLTSRVQLSCLHKSTQCHPRRSSAAQGIPTKQMDGIGPTGKHFGASGAQEEYVQPFS